MNFDFCERFKQKFWQIDKFFSDFLFLIVGNESVNHADFENMKILYNSLGIRF